MIENKIKESIKSFYLPLNQAEVRNLFVALYTQENLKAANEVLEKNEDYINTLQKRFKSLVLLRNKLVKNNYWEYIALWDKVPKEELVRFEEKSLVTVKKILNGLPENYKEPYWFNTIFNNLNYQFFIKSDVDTPKDVLDTFIRHRFCKKEDLSKIIIRKTKNWSASAQFNKKDGKTVIEYDPSYPTYGTAVAIAHELGHALQGDKEVDTYRDEKEAIRVELKYLKTLPENIQNVVLTEKLLTYATGFFEKEIYTNPNQDFAKAYARSIQKIHPEIDIQSNPLYVFNTHLIKYPCYSTVYAAIYNQLLGINLLSPVP